MLDPKLFAVSLGLNIVGATLLMSVLIVVIWLSWRSRLNRLLAMYVSVSLIWSLTALTGRVIMSTGVFGSFGTQDSRIFPLVYIVLIAISGNSPFLFSFVVEYIGRWGDWRLRIARWAAFAMNIGTSIAAWLYPDSFIESYGISSIGMITIEPREMAIPLIGVNYFAWYAVSLYLLWRYSWPRSKWIFSGAVTIALAFSLEIVTPVSDYVPLAIVLTALATSAFAYSIMQDAFFSPLRIKNNELEQSQHKLEQIISTIPGSVMITNLQGDILWANDQSNKMLSDGKKDLTLQNIGRFYANKSDRDKMIEMLRADGRVYDYKFQFLTSGGLARWGRMDVVPFEYEGTEATLGIVQDIHEHRMAEQSLQQMQKWESLAVLAGGIAHDFNNLLVAMLGQASLAKVKMTDANPGFRHVVKVENAARRAAALTKQMLAYSGQGAFSIRAINLSEMIQESLGLFAVSIPKNITLETEYAPFPVMAEVDTTQMQQIIMNLILNAVQAIGDDNGTIRVLTGQTDSPDLSVGQWMQTTDAPLEGTFVYFDVSDTGPGIPESQIGQIFDPFFTTRPDGSGLGLAAVLGIVRGHDGAIQVLSEVGKGTCFQVFLPAFVIDEDDVSAESRPPFAMKTPVS